MYRAMASGPRHLKDDRSDSGRSGCRRGAGCRPRFTLSPLVAAPLRWLSRNSLISLGFGFSCQREGELREFCMNISSAPCIVECETLDQHSNLLGYGWAPWSGFRYPSPVEPTRKLRFLPRSMPTNDGIRLDDYEDSLPSRPESKEGDPECSIEWGDPGSYLLLAVGGELLAEGQLDNDLLTLVPDEARSTTNNECQKVK
jgi:hypothetical protein